MKTVTLFLLLCMPLPQSPNTLQPTDLNILTGKKWTGTLMYLDYGTGKPVNIPTELTVVASPQHPGSYSWSTVYPKEPSHNSKEEIVISSNGTMIDDELVTERIPLPGSGLKFITQKSGEDNNKKATFRYTYLIGAGDFSRKKEVRYTGDTAWFIRNELLLKAAP